MMRNKKLRTVFCGILIFLLVFALFCLGDYGSAIIILPSKRIMTIPEPECWSV